MEMSNSAGETGDNNWEIPEIRLDADPTTEEPSSLDYGSILDNTERDDADDALAENDIESATQPSAEPRISPEQLDPKSRSETTKEVPVPSHPYIEVNQPDLTVKETANSPKESTHPAVLEFRKEREACSVELPDSTVGDNFVFKNRVVQYGPNGEIMEGVEIHQSTLDFLKEQQKHEENARDAIDNAIDVNDKYTELLDEIHSKREKPGAPIKILSRKTYQELGGGDNEFLEQTKNIQGFNGLGTIVIQEFSDQDTEMYGDAKMRQMLHHEESHSHALQGDATIYVITDKVSGNQDAILSKNIGNPISRMGIDSNGNNYHHGKVFEEGYAELKSYMRLNDDLEAGAYLGISADGRRELLNGANISNYTYMIPSTFTVAKSLDGNSLAYADDYAPAAYTLYQLEQERPGILENIALSRQDPRHFDQVIEAIEDIRPGLFKELYELPPNEMHKGLKAIDSPSWLDWLK